LGDFNFRLNYLIYPRRHDSTWDKPPKDAVQQYDLILALGDARANIPSVWRALNSTDYATLYGIGTRSAASSFTRLPGSSRDNIMYTIGALLSLVAVIVLGILLLGYTSSVAPFRARWANLAVAHLVGSTALTWLITITALASHSLLVWPVYAAILLLLPGVRRGIAWLKSVPTAESLTNGVHSSSFFNSSVRLLVPLGIAGLGFAAWIVNARLFGIGWDGYAIWQFKAQAFLHDGDLSILRDIHFADYAHSDYPLLVPLQTWWVGVHSGGYHEGWAEITGMLFGLDMLALFVAFASRFVRREPVMLGAALLLTLPVLAHYVASGYADIEMACYLVALAICLVRVTVSGDLSQEPLLAWFFAGIVLVKNEGMFAALSGLLVIGLLGRSNRLSVLAKCLLAAAAGYLPWLFMKHTWHLQSDLFEKGRGPHFTVSLVMWRIGTAIRGFLLCLSQTGPRALGWGLLKFILPIGLVCGWYKKVRVCTPLLLLCALQISGYLFIYVITYWPLLVHLETSVDRLSLHLVPVLLLAALIGSFYKPGGLPSVSELFTKG
jgi:hypothetical protein